jgi:hypothetical protein
MLKGLYLSAIFIAASILPMGATANSIYAPRWQTVHSLYQSTGGSGSGFLRCRLVPRYCFWSDTWVGPDYFFCGNFPVCYRVSEKQNTRDRIRVSILSCGPDKNFEHFIAGNTRYQRHVQAIGVWSEQTGGACS